MCLVYLKTGRRRPVWLGVYREDDVQGRIPRAWCCRCGREVFGYGPVCDRCERRDDHESQYQSLC